MDPLFLLIYPLGKNIIDILIEKGLLKPLFARWVNALAYKNGGLSKLYRVGIGGNDGKPFVL